MELGKLSSFARYQVPRKTNSGNLAYLTHKHDKHFGETRRSCWGTFRMGIGKDMHGGNWPQSRKKVFDFIFRGDDNVSMDGWLLDMGHVG